MYFVALLAWASIAQAAKHRLLVASVEKSAIHVLEFDDSRGSLKSLYEHGTVAPHPSIAIDKTKKFVHGVVPANVGVSVYALGRDYSLQNYSSVSLGNSSCNLGSAPDLSVIPGDRGPNYMYASLASNSDNCALTFYFHPNGTLPVQYRSSESNAHFDQITFNPTGTRFYALSSRQSMVKTFSVHDDGAVWMDYDQSWFPQNDSKVKRLVVGNNHFYGILEDANALISVKMEKTHVPEHDSEGSDIIRWKKTNILPEGTNSSLFYTSSLAISPSKNFLWVSSPSRSEEDSGYISVFLLDPRTGEIVKKLASRVLDASGGNPAQGARTEIVASPFGDSYVAVSSFPAGQVEILKLDSRGTEARISFVKQWIQEDGCCGSLTWVD